MAAAALADDLCEFVEVAILHILRVRRLYPPEAFERRAKWGVGVAAARHPALRQYVASLAHALREPLLQGWLDKVAVEVRRAPGDGGTLVERHVLGLQSGEGDYSHDAAQRVFREFVLRIGALDAMLPPLPPGCEWEAVVHSRQPDGPADEYWVTSPSRGGESTGAGALRLLPVRSTARGAPVSMQLLVELP